VEKLNQQKEAILKKKQQEQEAEMTRGMTKEEAAKLMARHRDEMAQLEGTIAKEQARQTDAMKERLALRKERNKAQMGAKVARQIQMAEVNKRKEQQKKLADELCCLSNTGTHVDTVAHEKALSKANHMKRIMFKGAFSQKPEVNRRVEERTIALNKRLGGVDPLAAVQQEVAGIKRLDSLASSGEALPSNRMQSSVRESVEHELRRMLSEQTIMLSDDGTFKAPSHLTFKELQDHINVLEEAYTDIAAIVRTNTLESSSAMQTTSVKGSLKGSRNNSNINTQLSSTQGRPSRKNRK